MTDITIGKRIEKLMTFYAMYSRMVDEIPDAPAAEVEGLRERRDTYKRWINEDLAALEAIGIEVGGMRSLKF